MSVALPVSESRHEAVLGCLQQLINLGQQKRAVLMERRHQDLHGIVQQENELLIQLEELKEGRQVTAGAQENDASSVAQVASLVVELQQLNKVNALLVQEHLSSVEMCLTLLNKAVDSSYSARGTNAKDKALRRFLDVQA